MRARYRLIAVTLVLLPATLALAHGGVKNPAVIARMDAMSDIGAQTKVLGQMAKGQTAFDATTAQAAAAKIADEAAQIPKLFRAPETDPKSEALPAIWDTFSDFTAKAIALQTAGETAAGSITDPQTLRSALGDIGGTCKSCHQDYRE